MHIELDGIDSGSIVIALPPGGPDGEKAQNVAVREIVQLRGKLRRESSGVRSSDVTAQAAILDALKLWFGSVLVASDGAATLRGARTGFDPNPAHVHFDLDLESISAERLRIEVVPTLVVFATTELSEAQLQVRGKEGRVKSRTARLKNFSLRLAAVEIEAPELTARELLVAWGDGTFYLRAEAVQAKELIVTAQGSKIRLLGLCADALTVENGDVAADGLRADGAILNLDLPAVPVDSERAQAAQPEADAGQRPAGSQRPVFDFRVLDGLSGHVHADLTLATTLPVLQRRRATHRFRIAIDEGSIDYRALESDLARLEDSLLDFSLRGDALVLEIGVPLLPTRGFGKALLRWPLSDAEIELARARRVRLSTLPQFAFDQPGSGEQVSSSESSSRPVELIEFDLKLLDVELSLTPLQTSLPAIVQALSLGSCRLAGSLRHHRSEDTPAGEVEAQLEGVRLDLCGLPLNDKSLDLKDLAVGRVAPCRVTFDDLRPRRATVELDSISIRRIAFEEPKT